METFSALQALCVGNSPVTGEFLSQRPVTLSFDVFFHLCLDKRLSKQSWGWWFETPLRPLWRHCNKRVPCLPHVWSGQKQSSNMLQQVRSVGQFGILYWYKDRRSLYQTNLWFSIWLFRYGIGFVKVIFVEEEHSCHKRFIRWHFTNTKTGVINFATRNPRIPRHLGLKLNHSMCD